MNAIDLLKELLKFRSITPDDGGCLEFIAHFMLGWDAKFINSNGVKNLLLTKKFSDGAHLAFAGHIDVVPPGEGWASEPFSPLECDGYIYARGAQDMKSGVAAFLHACKNARNFRGTISIILTSDEEGDAIFGTQEVLKFMQKQGELPEFAIVAEPTCDTKFGDTIKVGRRGSINGTLIIKGKQGHAAYPEKCINPAHQLAPIFADIAGFELDAGSEFFSPSKIVITDIRGGMQVCNVTPNDLKIMFNVRNSNLTSMQDLRAYLDKILNSLEFELSLKQSSCPFLTDKNSQIVRAMSQSVERILGVCPELNTRGGTSDARYLAEFGVKVVEFGVINDRIHALDERVSIYEVEKLTEIFSDLIENFT